MDTNPTAPADASASYQCSQCGARNAILVDASGEEGREAVVECRECGQPNLLRLHIREGGDYEVEAQGYEGIEASALELDVRYKCQYCGKRNIVRVDATAGPRQEFVDDCGACCSPNRLSIHILEDDTVEVEVERDNDD